MKNSAWYHKLWRDKLGELPLKEEEDAAWADMRTLLNEHLPVNVTSSGINNYKWSAFVKTLLIVLIAAIITIPAIVSNKHNTNSSKKNKHLPARVTGHKIPDHISGKRSDQHLKDLTGSDSTFHSSGSAEGLTPNQKDAINSPVISNKSITANQDPHLSNTTASTLKAKQYRTNNKTQSDILLSTSAFRNTVLSQHSGFKSVDKHTGSTVEGIGRNNQHSSISGYSSSTAYKSKYNQYSTHKSTLKTNVNGSYTNPVNNIDDKNTSANNTTSGVSRSAKNNNDKEAADTKIDPVKIPVDNADTKGVKSTGSKSRVFDTPQKTVKSKDNKSKAITKKPKADDTPPKYNYGLALGYNAGKGHSLYAGAFGSYQVKPKWLINIGLRLNTYTTVSGEYSHQSYYSPDSIPAFKVTDSRKVMALTIPVTLEYKITKNISLKGSPVISMQIKQSAVSAKLGAVPNIRDTIYHTQAIDSALKKTTINKLNVGFTGGVSIQIKHFSIDAMYQVLTPYKVNSGLGSYQKTNQNFQIGIGYRFK